LRWLLPSWKRWNYNNDCLKKKKKQNFAKRNKRRRHFSSNTAQKKCLPIGLIA
jgi:hypothetical protein